MPPRPCAPLPVTRRVLFAAGMIGAGFLAVPILSGSAAYAVAEAFGWKLGLDRKVYQAKEFYGVIAVSTSIGMLINFSGVNPIDALFWTAMINGFLTPSLLILLMLIANNRAIMGRRVNGPALNFFGWLTTGAMFAAAIALMLTWGG